MVTHIQRHMAVVVKAVLGSHFGGLVNSPAISEPILVVGLGCSRGVGDLDPWQYQTPLIRWMDEIHSQLLETMMK